MIQIGHKEIWRLVGRFAMIQFALILVNLGLNHFHFNSNVILLITGCFNLLAGVVLGGYVIRSKAHRNIALHNCHTTLELIEMKRELDEQKKK